MQNDRRKKQVQFNLISSIFYFFLKKTMNQKIKGISLMNSNDPQYMEDISFPYRLLYHD